MARRPKKRRRNHNPAEGEWQETYPDLWETWFTIPGRLRGRDEVYFEVAQTDPGLLEGGRWYWVARERGIGQPNTTPGRGWRTAEQAKRAAEDYFKQLVMDELVQRDFPGARRLNQTRKKADSSAISRRVKAASRGGSSRSRKNNPKTPYEAMAWSSDPLVREIYSEVDDRELDEIAQSIYDVYFGSESDWELADDDEDPGRSFQEPLANSKLTHEESVDAMVLASHIVEWANYAMAYGDYSDPPWEEWT